MLDPKYKIIQTLTLEDNKQLQQYLSKAREAAKVFETGNNGKRFDYDLCFIESCLGANSNTVQAVIWKAMTGTALTTPTGIWMSGIQGTVYDGLLDDFAHKYRESNPGGL